MISCKKKKNVEARLDVWISALASAELRKYMSACLPSQQLLDKLHQNFCGRIPRICILNNQVTLMQKIGNQWPT